MITGRRADASKLTARSRASPSGSTGAGDVVSAPGLPGIGGNGKHVVHREIDESHARWRADGGPQRVVDQSADGLGRGRGGGESSQRRDEWHVVDLLQRTHAPSAGGCPAAEDQQRRRILLGGGHGAHAVGDARARSQRGDAGLTRHLRPALGRERGGLLVSGVDQPDTLAAATVVDREQMAARQREDGVDPAGFEPAGDQLAGMERVIGVIAHARSLSTGLGYFRGEVSTVTSAGQSPSARRRDLGAQDFQAVHRLVAVTMESLWWLARGWVIAAVCVLVVLSLLRFLTPWGRQYWRITGGYFTGRHSVPAWLHLGILLFLVLLRCA